MVRQPFASRRGRGLAAVAALATTAILVSTAPAVRAANWGTELSVAGATIRVAEGTRDAETVERAVGNAVDLLNRLAKQPAATRAAVAGKATALKAAAAHGTVKSYLLRLKDCKENSIARMAGVAKKVRDNRSTLSAWIGARDRKWLKDSLAELDRGLPACLHLALTVDSFMTLNDPRWEIAGQFEVPLDFKMDPSGTPYWTGKQTAIVENPTLDNSDGCTWTIDPKPFSFDVQRLELDFGPLGTTGDVNLKEYATDITMVDTATGVCPDSSPPPTPIWGWSMIFAEMRDYLSTASWPELRGWQTATVGGGAEMYKVLKGTGRSGFAESTTLFLYRR